MSSVKLTVTVTNNTVAYKIFFTYLQSLRSSLGLVRDLQSILRS